MANSGDQLGVVETESALLKPCGQDAGACQERFVRHLAEEHPQGERRDRNQRGTTKGGAEGLGELTVSTRIRRDDVYGTGNIRIVEKVEYCSYRIVQRDPAHVLPA